MFGLSENGNEVHTVNPEGARQEGSCSLSSLNFASIRFSIGRRNTTNLPLLDFAHMYVKPRKPKVSGLPSPRAIATPIRKPRDAVDKTAQDPGLAIID